MDEIVIFQLTAQVASLGNESNQLTPQILFPGIDSIYLMIQKTYENIKRLLEIGIESTNVWQVKRFESVHKSTLSRTQVC